MFRDSARFPQEQHHRNFILSTKFVKGNPEGGKNSLRILNQKRAARFGQPLHRYGNEVLEQAGDLACFQIQVDIHERGMRGQTGHRAHLSQNRVDESRAYARAHLPDWHREAGGHTFQQRVMAQAEMRFRHAHRQIPETRFLIGRNLLLS